MIDLRNWRKVAEKFHADLDSCRTGSVPACEAALASPAIAEGQRPLLNEWRIAASPFKRAMALLSKHAGMAATAMLDFAAVRPLLHLEADQELLHAHVCGLAAPADDADWEEGVV
jgi:hypothetical protein